MSSPPAATKARSRSISLRSRCAVAGLGVRLWLNRYASRAAGDIASSAPAVMCGITEDAVLGRVEVMVT